MSKMTVIQLLNKIANKEEVPKKIKWCDVPFIYDKDKLDYVNGIFSLFRHDDNSSLTNMLNDEVEIIEDTPKEDNKIEKLDLSDWWEITSAEDCKPEKLAIIFNKNAKAFSSKINEIINKVNGR